VRANSDEAALATEVLVELILEVDEALVLELRHGAREAENSRSKHGAEGGRRGLDKRLLHDGRLGEGVSRRLLLAEEDAEGAREALDTQKVVTVRGDLDLQLRRRGRLAGLARRLDLLGRLRVRR
jgi:hypothetical protein